MSGASSMAISPLEPAATPAVALSDLMRSLAAGPGACTAGIVSYKGSLREFWTYERVHADVAGAADYLSSRGVRPGDRVGLWARNSHAWVVADLACILLGAVTVPFDPNLRTDADQLVSSCELRLLLAGSDTPPSDRIHPIDAVAGLRCRSPAVEPHRFAPTDGFTIKFTSGTTAHSKALLARAKHFDEMAEQVVRMFQLSRSDKALIVLPLASYLQRFFAYLGIGVGFDVVVGSPDRVMGLLAAEEPTVVVAVPQLLRAIYGAYARRGGDPRGFAAVWGSRIRSIWTGSAPIEPGLLHEYGAAGLPVHEGYGTSETGLIAKNCPGAKRTGSVGRPLRNREVAFDEDRQILVRSEYHANDHYEWGADGDSPFRAGGWVATGDTGHLDADGFLHVTGRVRDRICLSSGKKVWPARVEGNLLESALVQSCCVVGSGRPHLIAVLAARSDEVSNEDLAEVVRAANRRLEAHERVYGWLRADEPFSTGNGLLTASGKTRRDGVAETYRAAIERLYGEGRA